MRAIAFALSAVCAGAVTACDRESLDPTPGTDSARRSKAPATAVLRPAPPKWTRGPELVDSEVVREDLGVDAEVNARVAGFDLDGDGRDEIVVASARGLRVLGRDREGGFRTIAEAPARGGATALAAGDLDGDGQAEIAVGWGVHRDHRDAPALLSLYHPSDVGPGLVEEVVARPATSRAQFSTLMPARLDGRTGLLFAHFASKYEVRAVFAWREGKRETAWRERELGVMRMAAHWLVAPLPDGSDGIFVGRPYGDEVKSHGDVLLLEGGGSRTLLPSLRGVRSLAFAEFGPARRPYARICYGDGWHWRYREQGEGRLTCAQPGQDGAWIAELVDDTDGYEINTLATGDLDGDASLELVALGSDALYAYSAADDGDGEVVFTRRRLGPGGFDMAVVDSDADGRAELVLAGERPLLFRLP
jgi:hypothetical protein